MDEQGFHVAGLNMAERGVDHNARVQRWADGSATMIISDRSVFRLSGWEGRGGAKAPRALPADALEDAMADAERDGRYLDAGLCPPSDVENAHRAVRRAKARLRALARANEFSHFVTLTLDPARVDRYSPEAVIPKLNDWLHNQVRRHGLRYVLVPELHKDGAIHFHGFFGGNVDYVDSGTVIPAGGGRPRKPRSRADRERMIAGGGHAVLNVPGWRLGFSTAIELYGDYPTAVGYVCKYIGKQTRSGALPEKIGGRWVYAGGDLRKPPTELHDLDFDEVCAAYPGYDFAVPEIGARFRVIEFPAGKGVNTHDPEKAASGKAEATTRG